MDLKMSTPTTHLERVRRMAESVLRDGGLLDRGWSLRDIKRGDPDSVILELGQNGDTGLRVQWIQHGGVDRPAFARGAFYSAAYLGGSDVWDLDATETPGLIRELGMSACRLLADADSDVELVLKETLPNAPPVTLRLVPEQFLQWLSEGLAVGQEWVDGWRLTEVYPYKMEGLVLSFSHDTSDVVPRLRVRKRDDDKPAGFRSDRFDVTYRGTPQDMLNSERKNYELRLAAELVLLLKQLETPSLSVITPANGLSESPEVVVKPDRALNLAVPAPCGLKCSFCSVREEVEVVHDPTSDFVRVLKEDIRRSAANGVKVLRLNGIEPLNATYLFDLLEVVQECEFSELHLLSSCRPLSDEAFCRRFVDAIPSRFRIYVPIYGGNAELHDAVVGVPGSFDLVLQGVANLNSMKAEGGEVIFSTVVTSQNIDNLAAIRDLVRPLGLWWEVHQPFPNTSSATDRYRDVVVPMSQVVQACYPTGWWAVADLLWGEVLPCVALKHQRETGHQLITFDRFQKRVREPAGTFYQTADFEHSLGAERADAMAAATVPCPHRSSCFLSSACPGKVYALYETLYGLDELESVQEAELAALPGGAEVVTAVRKINENGG